MRVKYRAADTAAAGGGAVAAAAMKVIKQATVSMGWGREVGRGGGGGWEGGGKDISP